MTKKILCILNDSKIQFLENNARLGYKVQQINGNNEIDIKEYLVNGYNQFKDDIWCNFISQIGLQKNQLISALIIVNKQDKQLQEFVSYILNDLVYTHNKLILKSSDTYNSWTSSELLSIFMNVKNIMLSEISFNQDILISNNIEFTIELSFGDKFLIEDKFIENVVTPQKKMKINDNVIFANNDNVNNLKRQLLYEEDKIDINHNKSIDTLNSLISKNEEREYLEDITKEFNYTVKEPR